MGLAAAASWGALRGRRDDGPAAEDGLADDEPVDPVREPLPGDPGPERLLRLGKAAGDRGETRRAVEWFDTALAMDDTITAAWVAKGLCLEDHGQARAAAQAYREAARQEPGDAAHQYLLARALAQAGDPDEATRRLGAVVDAFPEVALRAREDPGFEALRDDPRFHAALGDL